MLLSNFLWPNLAALGCSVNGILLSQENRNKFDKQRLSLGASLLYS